MSWKYGMILVDKDPEDGTEDCELVELYSNDNGEFTSFCKARIHSIYELEKAYERVKKDGINTWFFENGKFKYTESGLQWKRVKK